MTRRSWLFLIMACAGCDSHGSVAPPEVGVIEFYGERSDISHPAEVQIGVDVPVTLRTFGNGCVSAAGSGVRYHGNTAIVVPYDNSASRQAENANCPDVLLRPTHTVALRFPLEGVGTIRVEGRNAPEGRWTVIESTILVTSRR